MGDREGVLCGGAVPGSGPVFTVQIVVEFQECCQVVNGNPGIGVLVSVFSRTPLRTSVQAGLEKCQREKADQASHVIAIYRHSIRGSQGGSTLYIDNVPVFLLFFVHLPFNM